MAASQDISLCSGGLLVYLAEPGALICSQCQYAVIPGQLKSHLAAHHQVLPTSQRRLILSKLEELPGLAWQPHDVQYPPPTAPAIPELPVYQNGLRCTATHQTDSSMCQYVCCTLHGMQQHCKQVHGWRNQQKRGGDSRGKQRHTANKMWQEGQSC